mmetsp:Transcript_29087/g.76157  ORF Transcript_29087/g.76157 Transcript_29087/m.76157 type:complete len:207 (-) Transcript_29087:380-1000(-)
MVIAWSTTASLSHESKTPDLYSNQLLAAAETATGPPSASERINGSSWLLGRAVKLVRPRDVSPEGRSRPCSSARSCGLQGRSLAWYGTDEASFRPFFTTYCMPSSTVAPSQPPLPPQCRGFCTHETSSCTDSLPRLFAWISRCASRADTVATAQQEPQAPWFGAGFAMDRFRQSTLGGRSRLRASPCSSSAAPTAPPSSLRAPPRR